MAADYAILSPIYSAIGMAAFAESMTPRLIDFAQRHDWLGRRVLDLGCGAGASLEWLTRRNYIAIGVDHSPEMLEAAQHRLESANLHHDVRNQDARSLGSDIGTVDLVLALDVVNELNSLRDLEALFTSVHKVLNPEKLFMFDMHTIQGLTEQGLAGDRIIHDSSGLTVITSNHYDFDRQTQERRFTIFHRAGDHWLRSEGARVLRGYPAAAIASLLQRCGFRIAHVITTDFEVFEPGVSTADRIIFLAEKQ